MSCIPLVEVTRGRDVECIHAGAVAVVDRNGRLLAHAGDPHFLTFARSTIKPFQALPFLAGNGPAHFSYAAQDIAMLCASHSGEAMHVERVEAMLGKAGCDVKHLRCGCHPPLRYTAFGALPPADAQWSGLHNNCSGKHAGFLAYCTQHGLPHASYLDAAHPLQQAVRRRVAQAAGLAPEDLREGIDGCSAPNYAMPLSSLAAAYARLAEGGDAHLSSLRDAMTGHPELVSGTGRSDLAFMRAAPGDWVAKIGADGVQAIGVRSAGLGIAVKIADGNMRSLYVATVAVLEMLGLIGDLEASPLQPWARPRLVNFSGASTGEVRSVFELRRAT